MIVPCNTLDMLDKEDKPKLVFVDEKNKATRVTNYEKHGELG
jgi:aspartate 1-decarboxylase